MIISRDILLDRKNRIREWIYIYFYSDFLKLFLIKKKKIPRKAQSILFDENSWQLNSLKSCKNSLSANNSIIRSLIMVSKILDAKYSLGEYDGR